MKRIYWLPVMAVALAACPKEISETSGVQQSKVATMLSAAEHTKFCTWAIEVQGGPEAVTECGSDFTVKAPTQAKCEADLAALPQTTACTTLTVADIESCINAIGDDPCTAIESPNCMKWISCVSSGE